MGECVRLEKMDFSQTIVAISTAPGVGAIGIVRMSGSDALAIIKLIFRTEAESTAKFELKSHQSRHGFILADSEIIDEVVVTAFLSPNSYTGEDVVEISCHGNPLIARRILSACLEKGARCAEPGEFTQRAFLNGKIDLTQAEAVLDLIQAKTEQGSQGALSILKGDLGKEVKVIREQLKDLLTNIVASIDFPNEVEQLSNDKIETVVEQSLTRLKALAKTARSGKYIREGLKLAIVGRPNAGKSSLLNCLLKVERAIVTDMPGTTRDSLEEQFDINGIPVVLVDTAGMRNTDDHIEKLGIERTKQVLSDSQLVLLVGDLTCGWQEEETKILTAIENKPWILLWNKSDLMPKQGGNKPDLDQCLAKTADANGSHPNRALACLSISAKTGHGIEELAKQIEDWVFVGGKPQEVGASLNTRQAALCEKAMEALQLMKKTLSYGMPHDCLATDLKTTLDSLSEITGVAVSEEVITAVFANFCIGK